MRTSLSSLTNLKDLRTGIYRIQNHQEMIELCKKWIVGVSNLDHLSTTPRKISEKEHFALLEKIEDWFEDQKVSSNAKLSKRVLERLLKEKFLIHFKEDQFYLNIQFEKVKVRKCTQYTFFTKTLGKSALANRILYFPTQKGRIFSTCKRNVRRCKNDLLMFFTAHSLDRYLERGEVTEFGRERMIQVVIDSKVVVAVNDSTTEVLAFLLINNEFEGMLLGNSEETVLEGGTIPQKIFFTKTFVSEDMLDGKQKNLLSVILLRITKGKDILEEYDDYTFSAYV